MKIFWKQCAFSVIFPLISTHCRAFHLFCGNFPREWSSLIFNAKSYFMKWAHIINYSSYFYAVVVYGDVVGLCAVVVEILIAELMKSQVEYLGDIFHFYILHFFFVNSSLFNSWFVLNYIFWRINYTLNQHLVINFSKYSVKSENCSSKQRFES